jgi:transcriptional regulator with XRE-family HTH domain
MAKDTSQLPISDSLTAVDPVDLHVGARLRQRRNEVGLSQDQLGRATGLTFQQIQKYERGINRVSASKLFHLAKVLDVVPGFFFDGLPQGQAMLRVAEDGGQAQLEGEPPGNQSAQHKRETRELCDAFQRITDAKQRKHVLELIKGLAKDSD